MSCRIVCYAVAFALLLASPHAEEVQGCASEVTAMVQLATSGMMGVQAGRQKALPQKPCLDWDSEMETAQECMDKCYQLQADREKGSADREMAWGIAGSLVGGAGGVYDAMPSKKKTGSLLQVARYGSNATVKSKFIGMAIAAVGLAVEIGGAVSARQDAYADADADNCEQLSSTLLLHAIDSQTENLKKHMDGKFTEVLDSVDRVRQDVAAVKEIIGKLELEMTTKLTNLQARTDEVLAVVKNIELQQIQMDLTNKLTEFMRCAGNVAHVFGMVQSGLSDKETYDWGLKMIMENSDSSVSWKTQVTDWKKRSSEWNSNFLQLMDQSAVHALEGMRCMSVLVSSGNLLNVYYEAQMRDQMETVFRREISAGHDTADVAFSKIYQISLEASKAVFEDDDVLLTSVNAISELRYVLAAIPRESYWEDFKVYAETLQFAFSKAMDNSVNNAWVMKFVKDAIREIFPATFPFHYQTPDDKWRLAALESLGGQWSRYSSSIKYKHISDPQLSRPSALDAPDGIHRDSADHRGVVGSVESVLMVRDVQDIIQIDLDGQVTTVTPASMYLFKWANVGSTQQLAEQGVGGYPRVTQADEETLPAVEKQHFPEITGDATFGFSGLSFTVSGSVSQKIENVGDKRRLNQPAWSCRVQDVINKAKALAAVTDCVVKGLLVPFSTSPAIATSFETGTGHWTSSGAALPFTRTKGVTSSSSTGPNGAAQGSFYMYTEASSPNFPNKDFYLQLGTGSMATGFFWYLLFKYSMNGKDMGSLDVEVQTSTSQWTTVWHLEGDQGSDWVEAKVGIPGSASSVRFHAVSGKGYESDLAIDDIKSMRYGSVNMDRCLNKGKLSCPSSADLDCTAWFPQCVP